jgi:phage tail-like protein
MGGSRTGFMECSGLESETEVAEYREGGDNATVKKSPGLTKFSDITLKRGQILDEGQNDLYAWYQQVFNLTTAGGGDKEIRRDIDIVQYERGDEAVRRWRVYNCFPNKYKAMGDLNATSNDNSIEELTLVNEGWEQVPV